MEGISIIVPIKNEAPTLYHLVTRIDKSIKHFTKKYEIIFIDDHSTDTSLQILKKLSSVYPIKFFKKVGRPGKAYSILEGAQYAQFDHLVMIDGDLQYPPEVIPRMCRALKKKDLGVIVAKRRVYKDSFLRNIVSQSFNFIFCRLLHQLTCDVQSGLKLFKKEILDYIDQSKITQWTFDLSLLLAARALGYSLDEVDITFDKRVHGISKVNILKTAFEIGINALKLRFNNTYNFLPSSFTSEKMLGAGIIHKNKLLVTHSTLPYKETALFTLTAWQRLLLIFFALCILAGFYYQPLMTIVVLVAVLTVIYFLDVLFSVYLIIRSLHFPPEIHIKKKEIKKIDEKSLPIYSILCPLYKEASVLAHFVKSIQRIDWPKKKLDVLLLLEEDDTETISAAKSLNLPSYIRTVIVPHSYPKTKPKACNFGLCQTRGEYLVIYDAEDRPEPDQLKKAYLGFTKVSADVVCLQAKLNYYNPHQNILTKLFTAEYSLWFDVILPGLQSINTIIPLGGTSNHFKTKTLLDLKGWDPFNVTEDCDLGVRLYKKGFKTAIINSTTYEEANSAAVNWLRQRSRWIKGYIQTFLVHNRDPIRMIKDHRLHALIFQLIIGSRVSFMVINPILWVATVSYFAVYSNVGAIVEAVYITPVFYMAVISLVFGNFMYLYNYMIGCAKRNHWDLIKYVFLIPFYWLMASIAAYYAFYQLIINPHYWEKTIHGLHLKLNTGKQEALSKVITEPVKPVVSYAKSVVLEQRKQR